MGKLLIHGRKHHKDNQSQSYIVIVRNNILQDIYPMRYGRVFAAFWFDLSISLTLSDTSNNLTPRKIGNKNKYWLLLSWLTLTHS